MTRRHLLTLLATTPLAAMDVSLPRFAALTRNFSRSATMPALFIGHGHPMNAILDNDFTRHLTRLGQQMERPQAVLVISAHWLTRGTAVSVNPSPAAIYDFGDFDPDLFQVKYAPPGAPDIARTLKQHLTLTDVREADRMGLDHGAWTVLKFIYPRADVPVFQLSIDHTQPADFHYRLAQELRYLRERGVLIIGSGNLVHNLGLLNWSDIQAPTFDWALEFDHLAKARLDAGDHNALVRYEALGRSAQLSIPTPDHYWPMLYVLGLQRPHEPLRHLYEGYQFGSISMRCFQVG